MCMLKVIYLWKYILYELFLEYELLPCSKCLHINIKKVYTYSGKSVSHLTLMNKVLHFSSTIYSTPLRHESTAYKDFFIGTNMHVEQ